MSAPIPVSVIETREEISMVITATYGNTYQVYDDNTFDCDYDYESGSYRTSCPVGEAKTIADAIEDFFDQYLDKVAA